MNYIYSNFLLTSLLFLTKVTLEFDQEHQSEHLDHFENHHEHGSVSEEEGIVVEMPSSIWSHEELTQEGEEAEEVEHHSMGEIPHHEMINLEMPHHQMTSATHMEIIMTDEKKHFLSHISGQNSFQLDCRHHCNIRGDGVWPMMTCSSKFCACANGIAYTQNCPSFLIFDIRYLVCNWKYDVPFCHQ